MNHRFTLTAALASAAASTALLPLLAGGKWFGGGLGAIIVVALVGTATRQRALRGVPAAICLLCSLLALVLYLNVLYASKSSFAGLFPTHASLLQLWRLAGQGMSDTQKFAPPVPGLPGLDLLTDAGIGLVAAVTDLIAVRLRRCALAGLPLLVLFSVPIATDAGHNTLENLIVFCIGMAGYLALLSADGRERLRLWGRLVTPWNTGRDEPAEELGGSQSVRALAASGRRIGVAAIVLALFAPLLVPGLHAHKLFHGSGNGSGLGGPGTGQGLPRPLALMSGELKEPKAAPVLTYTTTAPRTDPQNLQVYVLGNLTETDWTFATPGTIYSLSGGQMPPIPGLPNGHWPTVRTTVQFDPSFVSARSYLPLPYPARQVNVVGNWQADSSTLMAYSPSMPLSALSYSAVSDNVDPTPAQLDAAPAGAGPMGAYLAVPAPYRSLLSLARRVTEDATTPGEQAAALQNWFRNTGGFTYSLNAPQAAGAATLRNFLEKSKRGYCQQFAYAMGVLARLLKIPARVVVGYTAGTYEGQGRWSVMSSDAHAWPELYIRGYGWMPFEPTPSGPGVGQATATTPGYSLIPGSPAPTGTNPGTGVTSPGTGTQSSLTGNQRKREQALPIGGPLGGQGRKGDTAADTAGVVPLGPAGSSLPIPLIVVAALLVIALLTPRTRRSLTRRRRWMSARDNGSTAHAAWSELLDNLEDYGIRHGPGETPRAVAKRIGAQQRLGAPGREALDRLAQAEERASFAPEPGPAGTLRADVTEVRSAVAASVSKQSRWQARLLPASSVSRTRQTLSHALDAFNWAELALARATRRLLQAHPNES